MSNLPQLFGFHGVMLAASPFFFFEFWRQEDAQPSRVTVRQPVGSFDLSKLSQLGILVNELTDGKLPISEGISRLNQIDSLPLPYARPVVALGYALCGAGFAVLLSAGWLDVLFAALLSLVVYA
ncbi:MAG: threonine/serine exporter family protein, partial [Caldilineaceae bacterium]|nr:threonine/serine exporter family protein [Caldilineaceae bacterium]